MVRKKVFNTNQAGEAVDTQPFCYYCDRKFDDEKTLVQHQRIKHFCCFECGRTFSSVTGLRVHMLNAYKKSLKEVPRAMAGRENPDVFVHGMEGIPQDVLEERMQKVMAEQSERQERQDREQKERKERKEREEEAPELQPSGQADASPQKPSAPHATQALGTSQDAEALPLEARRASHRVVPSALPAERLSVGVGGARAGPSTCLGPRAVRAFSSQGEFSRGAWFPLGFPLDFPESMALRVRFLRASPRPKSGGGCETLLGEAFKLLAPELGDALAVPDSECLGEVPKAFASLNALALQALATCGLLHRCNATKVDAALTAILAAMKPADAQLAGRAPTAEAVPHASSGPTASMAGFMPRPVFTGMQPGKPPSMPVGAMGCFAFPLQGAMPGRHQSLGPGRPAAPMAGGGFVTQPQSMGCGSCGCTGLPIPMVIGGKQAACRSSKHALRFRAA
ncbi:unnamed protein product [Effrenium voratum]|nr:unnamed protein product [Effrenium voratum]